MQSNSVKEHHLRTSQHNQLLDITHLVREDITASGIRDGMALIFVPHTTAGVTINENADPDVVSDILLGLDQAFPDRREFRHAEGNSAAHLKASMMGASSSVIIEQGQLVLGTWQGIYFCEFDGPRTRKVLVKILSTG